MEIQRRQTTYAKEGQRSQGPRGPALGYVGILRRDSLEIRQDDLDPLFVPLLERTAFPKLAYSLGRLVRQDVVFEGLFATDFPSGRLAKTLGGAAIRFHFRHEVFPGSALLDSVVLQHFLAARTGGLGGVVPHAAHSAAMGASDPSLFDSFAKQ